nr:MAG TPA: hypothetical protein [Caudoviricetes sp.]
MLSYKSEAKIYLDIDISKYIVIYLRIFNISNIRYVRPGEMFANSLQNHFRYFLTCSTSVCYVLLTNIWKACNRLKRFGGSNPPLSAET